jgi:hypothetical protein
MADSENSRTLSAITRRKLLWTPAALMTTAGLQFADGAIASPMAASDSDPVLRLWSEWQTAHVRYLQFSEHRWEVEIQLFRNAKFLEDEIHLLDGNNFHAMTEEEILMGLALPRMKTARAMARADLVAMTRRWDEMDDEVGYSRALDAEAKAAEERSALGKSLLSTPTRSVAGAAAKLSCFVETNTPVAHYRKMLHPELRQLIEPTFPELRAILTDLVLIGGVSNGLFRE